MLRATLVLLGCDFKALAREGPLMWILWTVMAVSVSILMFFSVTAYDIDIGNDRLATNCEVVLDREFPDLESILSETFKVKVASVLEPEIYSRKHPDNILIVLPPILADSAPKEGIKKNSHSADIESRKIPRKNTAPGPECPVPIIRIYYVRGESLPETALDRVIHCLSKFRDVQVGERLASLNIETSALGEAELVLQEAKGEPRSMYSLESAMTKLFIVYAILNPLSLLLGLLTERRQKGEMVSAFLSPVPRTAIVLSLAIICSIISFIYLVLVLLFLGFLSGNASSLLPVKSIAPSISPMLIAELILASGPLVFFGSLLTTVFVSWIPSLSQSRVLAPVFAGLALLVSEIPQVMKERGFDFLIPLIPVVNVLDCLSSLCVGQFSLIWFLVSYLVLILVTPFILRAGGYLIAREDLLLGFRSPFEQWLKKGYFVVDLLFLLFFALFTRAMILHNLSSTYHSTLPLFLDFLFFILAGYLFIWLNNIPLLSTLGLASTKRNEVRAIGSRFLQLFVFILLLPIFSWLVLDIEMISTGSISYLEHCPWPEISMSELIFSGLSLIFTVLFCQGLFLGIFWQDGIIADRKKILFFSLLCGILFSACYGFPQSSVALIALGFLIAYLRIMLESLRPVLALLILAFAISYLFVIYLPPLCDFLDILNFPGISGRTILQFWSSVFFLSGNSITNQTITNQTIINQAISNAPRIFLFLSSISAIFAISLLEMNSRNYLSNRR